ncbi:Biotin synthase [Trichinella spiralis]|uniref:Biotin synthase n=1 Tax=Trichinella spiralis TaxID=6334 RepID=A0ABR3KQ06_TRISP
MRKYIYIITAIRFPAHQFFEQSPGVGFSHPHFVCSGDLVEVGSAFIDHVDLPFGGRAKLRSVRPSQPVSQTRPWRQTHCQVDCLASQIYFNVRWCRSASGSTLSLAEKWKQQHEPAMVAFVFCVGLDFSVGRKSRTTTVG